MGEDKHNLHVRYEEQLNYDCCQPSQLYFSIFPENVINSVQTFQPECKLTWNVSVVQKRVKINFKIYNKMSILMDENHKGKIINNTNQWHAETILKLLFQEYLYILIPTFW